MLIYLTEYLTRFHTGFNVFNYLTLRAILGALTALVLSFAMGPLFIKSLSSRRVGQSIRELGPETHLPKAGTPTMGGALILASILVGTLLWASIIHHATWCRPASPAGAYRSPTNRHRPSPQSSSPVAQTSSATSA